MGNKNKSKLYKIADIAVTVAVIVVLITAIIAGVIFVVRLVRENNTPQIKTEEKTIVSETEPKTYENQNAVQSEVIENSEDNNKANSENIPEENEYVSENLTENVEKTANDGENFEEPTEIRTTNKPAKPVAVSYEGDLTSAPIFLDGGQTVKMTVDSDNTFAVYFYALIPFSGIEIKCASGSDVNLSLYAYDTDYATSVANEPINSIKYSDTESDSWLASFFGSVDAGEYFAVISSDKSAELFITDEQSALTNGHAVVFINGELDLYSVPYLKVIFDGQTANGEYFN